MQIEALKIYCDVISHNSFSKAAKINGVTQSTASQAVRRLESYFDTALLDRSCRPFRVSNHGRLCYDRCRKLIESFYQLEHDLLRFDESHRSEIRAASIYSVGFSYLKKLNTNYSDIFPHDKLIMTYDHPGKIKQTVLEGSLDVGIIAFPAPHRELTIIPWLEEEMVLACSPSHPLSGSTPISVKELNNCSIVTFNEDLEIGRKISSFLKRFRTNVEPALRFDNIEAIKRAVEGSAHIAILPKPTLERELASKTLCARPFRDAKFVRPLGIIHRKIIDPTAATRRFINLITDTYQTITKEKETDRTCAE